MEKHGTTFPGWYITFQQAALAALPRPPQIDQDIALGWAENGESFTRVLAETLLPKCEDKPSAQPISPAVPGDGEWFELEVDNDIDPMDIVRAAGYDPKNWKYLGPKLSGKQTIRAKLARIGYVSNLDAARRKADELGYQLIEGQAREPFKARFPKPDGKGPVVFGGSGWRSPDGRPRVASLRGLEDAWSSSFGWSDSDFHDNWRWLVVGK